MRKIILTLVFVLGMAGLTAVARAEAPDWMNPDSPLALGLHPRLFFIPESYRQTHPDAFGFTVSEMRERLARDYRTEFQVFIDTMDTAYTLATTDYAAAYKVKESYYVTFDIYNNGLLYLLDPSIMSLQYGFTFKHTKQEYGQKAMQLVDYATDQILAFTQYNDETGPVWGTTSWGDYFSYSYSGNSTSGMNTIAPTLALDWFPELINDSLRNKIAQAVIHLYEIREEPEALFHGKQVGRSINGNMGTLGLYGEVFSDPTIQPKLEIILNSFKRDWLDNIVDLWNFVNENGSYSFESSDDCYYWTPFLNLPVYYIMSSSLNTNYYYEHKYLGESIIKTLYDIEPFPIDGYYYFIASGDYAASDGGPVTMWPSKLTRYYASLGSLAKADPDKASLARWVKDVSKYPETRFIPSYGEEYKRMYYSFLLFFLDDKSIVPKSPTDLKLPLSANVGGRQYLMRTGFESDSDSLVTFWPRKYHSNDGGHAHRDFGNFEIYKYGKLIGHRQIAKSFCSGNSGAKNVTQHNMWYNTMGVYRPGDNDEGYNTMGYRGGYIDYRESAINFKDTFNPGGANYVGDVPAEDLQGKDYDYISYDYKWAWNPAYLYTQKVDYANREFVYLRTQGGIDDEYVVVFDRINSLNPEYKKRFILHPIGNPELLDNNNQSAILTAEDYPNDADGISGGRWVSDNANIVRVTGIYSGSHGRLFSKALSPEKFRMIKTGGPGHYWEDAEGVLLHDGGCMEGNDSYKYIFAEYSIWVEATEPQNYDNFLNVIQFGDSNTLSQMNPATRIDGDAMVGAFIDDPHSPRVVLFSQDQKGADVNSVNYSVSYLVNLTGKHLLTDMEPGKYDVYKNGVKVHSDLSALDKKGTLYFEASGDSSDEESKESVFQVVRTGEIPAPITITGDINADGQVNVLDVQLCVNVVLGFEAREEIVNKARQVTAPEEECNVLDVQAVVNEILNSV